MLHKKQKALTQTPTSPPAPLPWGERSMFHKKQKALTQTHKKAPPPQRPKPHHLMKCAHKGAFRGAWGDWSPHKKKPGVGGLVPPQKKLIAKKHV